MSSALGQNSSCTEAQGRRSTLESGLGEVLVVLTANEIALASVLVQVREVGLCV